MLFQPLSAGHVLDGLYQIEARVGEGAMGTVYRALDRMRGRTVAIKILKPDAAEDDRSRRLFRREARAMARLDHPGIIGIYGFGDTTEGLPYLAMEWVEGRPLHKLALPPTRLETVVTLVDRILEALAHAHARGVIHRDLKPANILLAGGQDDVDAIVERGVVKLVDFGVARVFDDTLSAPPPEPVEEGQPRDRRFAALARQGFTVETQPYEVRAEGTPRYMAPELYRGKEGVICPANDIYAVGVIFYELLSGKKLYDTFNPAALMAMQLRGEVPECVPREELRVRYAPNALLRQLLNADPFERVQHCAEVRRHLIAWYRDQKGARSTVLNRAHHARRPSSSLNAIWDEEDPLQRTHSAPTQAIAGRPPEINLLAWRPMPVLGRAAEQAWLWQHLEEVGASGSGRVLIVHGDPGIGKTQLVRWLAEAATEDGLATTLWCDVRGHSLADGLRLVLERHLFAQGLDGSFLRARLLAYLHRVGLALAQVSDRTDDPRWQALRDRELDLLIRLLRPHAPPAQLRPDADPVEFYRVEVAGRPDDAELRLRYAQELANSRRDEPAVAQYAVAAQLLLQRGMLPEAAATCQAIFRLQPHHTETQLLLARIFAQQNAVAQPAAALSPAPGEEEEVIVLSPRHAVQHDAAGASDVWGRWRPGGFDFDDDSTASGAIAALRRSDLDEETQALLERVLRRAARAQPAIFVLDGVEPQDGAAVLHIVEHLALANRARPFPLLVVLTAPHDLQGSTLDPASLSTLQGLGAWGLLHELQLGPLADAHIQAILQRFESLTAAQQEAIRERAEGNPLFAVELAQHAVGSSEDSAARALTPRSISDVWRRRVGLIATTSRVGLVALRILELAAVLGEPVRLDVLLTAWESPELAELREVASEVSEAWELWVDAGVLLEERLGQARFRYALLRETLLSDILATRRRSLYHAAAARAWLHLDMARKPADRLRLAQHLTEARDAEAAWPWAIDAAQLLIDRSAWRSAQEAFALCERILDQLGASAHDPRRDPVDVGFAHIARRNNDTAAAQQRANALRHRGRVSGLSSQLGMGELILAEIALHEGQADQAQRLFDRALSHFQTCDDSRGQLEALLGLARVGLRLGQIAAARARLTEANTLLGRAPDPNVVARTNMLYGQVERFAGRAVAAEVYFENASRAFENAGNMVGLARSLGELGQVALDQGDLAKAELYFQAYLRQSETIGDLPALAQARANLGQTLLRAGRASEAADALDAAFHAFIELHDAHTAAIVQAILASALARAGRWTEAAAALLDCLHTAHNTALFDFDLAESLEAIAHLNDAQHALGGLYADLCDACWRQWTELGAAERARDIAVLAQRAR